MTKLYKAKLQGSEIDRVWLVNDKGVAPFIAHTDDEDSIQMAKDSEETCQYEPVEIFEENTVNPVLIAEW